jgi:hypothetical protein
VVLPGQRQLHLHDVLLDVDRIHCVSLAQPNRKGNTVVKQLLLRVKFSNFFHFIPVTALDLSYQPNV